MQSMRGRRVLIVEDEYLLATDLGRYFRNMGAHVLGPVGDVQAAREQVGVAEAAVLDIELNGEEVFPIADELARRGVPFVFFTAHDDIVIPPRFRHAAHLLKPADWSAVFEALFPSGKDASADDESRSGDDVVSMLPKLRLTARLMMGDSEAADRLVELTLERALPRCRTRPADQSVEAWLTALLDDTYGRHGLDLRH